MRWRSLLSATALMGCSFGGPGPLRYAGQAPVCGRAEGGGTTATLTRLGKGFAFAPYDGSLVVTGTSTPDGALAGSLLLHPASASGATASARPAQSLTVSGHLTPETATVTYAAPGCTDTVTLSRVRPPLL